jgi:hypothetical protein
MSTNQLVKDKLNVISDLYIKSLMELELVDELESDSKRIAILDNFFLDVEVIIHA